MKTKGITFWEQHVERLVLGFAVVVTAVLIALQFIGEPNAVKVGATEVSPGTVDATLVSKAEEINRQLDEPATANPMGPVKEISKDFAAQMQEPVLPVNALAAHLIGPPVVPVPGERVDDRPFRVAVVPKPAEGVARQYFDSFAPEAVEQTPELKAVVAAEPFDVSWATVYFRFPVAEVLKQFAEPGPNNEAALPRTWYQDRVDFIDVKLEREEYVNDQWTNRTLIGPMVGRVSFRPELDGVQVNDALRKSILERAGDPMVRQQVIQPPFYATLNKVWTPPPEEGLAAEVPAAAENLGAAEPDKQDPVLELTKQRAKLQKRLNAVLKDLDDAGCPDTPPAEDEDKPEKPQKPAGGGKGQDAPGTGGGIGPGGDRGMRTPGGAANLTECKRLWAQRRRFEQLIAKIDGELQKLGQQAPKEEVKVEVEEEEPDVINIWAHDLSIEPGKVYRYRVTVEVYNPLFGRKPELPEEQKTLADQFVLASEASDWTEPLVIEPPLRLFVTNAQPANPGVLGNIGVGSAVAEVYRFHNGRWWLESFRVQPGDRIGGRKGDRGGSQIDYTTDWFVLDVVEVLAADRNELERNFGATVVLQSLNASETTVTRSPRDDYSDPERRRLYDEVKLAELGEAVAAAGDSAGGAGP